MRALTLGMLSTVILACGCASSPEAALTGSSTQRAPAAGWAGIQARTIVLRARRDLPKAQTSMRVVGARDVGWNAPEGLKVVVVEFKRPGADRPAAAYVLSPWQRLWWMGTGLDVPAVVSVNRYSMVIRRTIGLDRTAAGKRVARRADAMVRDLLSVAACEHGTQIGHPPGASPVAMHPSAIQPKPYYRFRRYYVGLHLPDVKPGKPFSADKTAWDHLTARRVFLLTRHKADPKAPGPVVRFDFYPPADVLRTRPRPPLPGEQVLAPGTDLTAASAKMDRGLQKVFGDASTALLKLRDPADTKAREAIVQQSLPELKKVIFAHPAHTGPAHAAGAAALEKARRRVGLLVISGRIESCETGSWRVGPLVYRPSVVDALRKLPAATPANLPALLDAFDKYAAAAKAARGRGPLPSDVGLLLAETGDRIRTVVLRGPSKQVRAILAKKLKGTKDLRYRAWDLRIEDPGGKHIHRAGKPVEIVVSPDAPGPAG